jgi:hypothetical protein
MRVPVVLVLGSLVAASLPGQTPGGTQLSERVEVREVAVLADLPAELRGRPLAQLASELLILEDGAPRELSALQPLAPAGAPAFGTVQVAFDARHCRAEVVERGALALGERAAVLASLGPVSLAQGAGGDPFAPSPATRDSDELARRLIARASGGCPRLDAPSAPGAASCAAAPCLLIWVSSGWGSGPALAEALAEVEPVARTLAAAGWTVLGLAPVEAPRPPSHARLPETRPGDGRASWTVDLLDPRDEKGAPSTDAEYQRHVDLGLAPLRRVVAATIGELVTVADRLPEAFEALRGRTLLYYRTDRAPGGGEVSLEVREAREGGARMRVQEWAPALRP